MANWELIDHDRASGLKTYIGDHPEDPDGVLVRHEQAGDAIAAILDRNKEAQADPFDKSADMWHAAHIPVGVMFEWLTKHGVDAWRYASDPDVRKAVNRLLNSNEYRYLRVRNFVI